jgi:uncharacterized protein
MNPFDHSYFLGYINEVNPQYVKIHFPSSNLLEKFHFKGSQYAGGNVGNFVVIEGEEFGFLGRVIESILPDSERKEISEKAIKEDKTTFHPSGKIELLLSFDIYNPTKIQKTVSKYPSIGAKVFSCSDEQIRLYIKEFGRNEASSDEESVYGKLGKLTSNNADCHISLNALFGRHCAVIGTTGGGKSWTTAKLIELLNNETDNKVILIDATGEYEKLTDNSYSVGKNVYFPYNVLTNSDFCFLFREHSPNPVTVLCESINSLRFINEKIYTDGEKIGKNSLTINRTIRENIHKISNTKFDILELTNQIKNECVKIGRSNIYEADDFKLGYCSHLLNRVELFLNNLTIKKAFGLEDSLALKNLIDIIDDFVNPENKEKVLRIGFENLSYDFSIREIIVDFIASYLLRKSRKRDFKENPVVLFIDEAHQFLNKRINADDDSSFYLQSIDLIAKESRKYGLFLCLSTQMPRDIPIGTLSQIGTFIVHRLINEQDKKAVENASSSANKSVLSFLPILGSGEALLIGVEFPMPLMIKLDKPIIEPDSKTPKLTKRAIG